MISWQVANISCVVEVLVDVLIATFVTHAGPRAIKHSLSVHWVHVIVALVKWWLSSTQEVVVDLLVGVNASIVLLWQFVYLWWLPNESLWWAQVNVVWLCLRWLLSWNLCWWLVFSGSIIHLLGGSGFLVVVSWWLVVVIFSVHFD
jgi:hypothetical protein